MNSKLLWMLTLLTIALPASADVYRWVDKDGKVHFTDKKPAENAENVTEQVNKQNIDNSSEELRKVENILRKENDADREYYRQQQAETNAERQQLCTRARKRLNEISGNVIFIDNAGKVAKTTQQERQRMVADQNAIIEKNCD